MGGPACLSRRTLSQTLANSAVCDNSRFVTLLHDWIDELCDALELELDAEVDEALILDLARDAAHSVERPAAPVTTFLVGYAAGLRGGKTEDVELLAGRAQVLAEKWGGDTVSADDFKEEDLVGTE